MSRAVVFAQHLLEYVQAYIGGNGIGLIASSFIHAYIKGWVHGSNLRYDMCDQQFTDFKEIPLFAFCDKWVAHNSLPVTQQQNDVFIKTVSSMVWFEE